MVNYVGLRLQCLLLCPSLNKTEFSGHNLVKTVSTEAYEFRPDGAKIFQEHKQTDGHKYRQAGVIKLVVNFRNFVNGSNCLTLRRLMSYIYGAPIFDVSRSHTTTQHSR